MAPNRKIKKEKKIEKVAQEGDRARQLTMSDMMRDSIKRELRLKQESTIKEEAVQVSLYPPPPCVNVDIQNIKPEEFSESSDTETDQDVSEDGTGPVVKKAKTDVKAERWDSQSCEKPRDMPVLMDLFAPTSTSTSKQEFLMKKAYSEAMKKAFGDAVNEIAW